MSIPSNVSLIIRGVCGACLAGAICLVALPGCMRSAKPDGGGGGGGGGGAAAQPITPPEDAVVVKQNRLMGGLVSGGALGAGGGYVIGVRNDKNDTAHREEAVAASKGADRLP